MRKFLVLAFTCLFISIKAQIPNELLIGFDEKKVIKELKKKGLDPSEFLFEEKRQYAIKRGHELGYYDYQKNYKPKSVTPVITSPDNGKTRYINLTPQITSSCPNSYFANLDFTNWTCGYWAMPNAGTDTWATSTPSWTTGQLGVINDYLTQGGQAGHMPTSVPTLNRHVILTTPPTNNDPVAGPVIGYDSLAINPITNKADIPLLPPGGTSSLRLGNATSGVSFTYAETERIIYNMVVSANTTQFTYQYAVVLNNPQATGAHTPDETPFFEITVMDQTGAQIGGSCGKYLVTSDQANTDTSYHYNSGSTAYNNFLPVYYKNWTTVTIDLSAQIGQAVTIEFRTADCSRSGHFGYAYLDAYCGSLVGSASGICGGAGSSVLNAPPGFTSYQWYDPSGGMISGATASSYTAATVNVGDTFTVHMVSPSGCNSLIKIGITGSFITANYGATSSCEGGSQGTASAIIPGGGNFSYSWYNGGGTNVGATPTITGIPAGTYSIHIVDNTGTCPPKDTTVKVLQTYPALQTVTDTVCGTYVVLTSPAGAPFAWYNTTNNSTGTTTQNYTVNTAAGGQHYTVTYLNPTSGCRDSLRTDLVATNINFLVYPGNPCNGGNNGHIQITASQDSTYDWSVTGPSSGNGSNVSMPPNVVQLNNLVGGTYTVQVNVSGNPTCKFTQAVTLVPGQIPPPTVDTLKGCALDQLSIPTTTVSGSSHNWYNTIGSSLGSAYPYITNGVNVGDVYTDTIRDANGCKSVYKAILKQKSFKLNITAPDKIKCHNDSTGQLKATVALEINGPLGTPYVFTWVYPSPYTSPAPINGTSNVPQSTAVNGLHAGTYTVNVQSGTCVGTATYTLANPAALPDDSLFSYFCPKDSMAWLYAEAGHSAYHWLHNGVPVAGNNNDSIAVTPATVGDYIVWYTVAGCRDTARKLFTFYSYHAVRPDKIVNIFTPNGDDRNDKFYPFHDTGISPYEVDKQMEFFQITIYNRWGTKVFETNEYSKPWDGTVNGTNQDDGTYYYILRYKSNCATKADVVEKHGFVQLLR